MTTENRRLNVAEELERAGSALASADLLNEHGQLKDAISRLYYGLLYHVRAVLLSQGIEARSHEGALRLFSLHFVKSGIFQPEAAHLFSRLMKYREEADYNPSYVFAREDYPKLRREVDILTEGIREYLKGQGCL